MNYSSKIEKVNGRFIAIIYKETENNTMKIFSSVKDFGSKSQANKYIEKKTKELRKYIKEHGKQLMSFGVLNFEKLGLFPAEDVIEYGWEFDKDIFTIVYDGKMYEYIGDVRKDLKNLENYQDFLSLCTFYKEFEHSDLKQC